MGEWNPNEPAVEGIEWLPPVATSTLLPSATTARLQLFRSTIAETIIKAHVPFASLTAPNGVGQRYLVELFGAPVCSANNDETYRPNEDTAAVNVQNQAGAVVNLWQSIDEAALNTADYVKTVGAPAEASYTFKVDSAAYPIVNRVRNVRVTFVLEQTSGQAFHEVQLRKQGVGFIRIFGRNIASVSPRQTFSVDLGDVNPFTGLPWTYDEIRRLDDTVDPARLSLVFRWTNILGGAGAEARVYQAFVTVESAQEARVAWGSTIVTAPGWVGFSLVKPNEVPGWPTKAAAIDYYIGVRRILNGSFPVASGTGGVIVPADGQAAWTVLPWTRPANPAPQSYAPTLDDTGCILALNAPSFDAYAFALERNTTTASQDGQPYDSVNEATVDLATVARQQITPSVAAVAQQVRFYAKAADSTALPTAPLVAQVRIDGSGVAVGGPASLDVADLGSYPQVGAGWHDVVLDLDAAALLAAATQYRVEFTSATNTLTSWQVAYGDTIDDYGRAGYNGGTDQADVNGDGYDQNRDLWAQLLDPPDPPAGFAVAGVSVPITSAEGGCTVDEVEAVDLSWTATALTFTFAAYVLERSCDGQQTWQIIAELDDEATTSFRTFTAPRGVECCYRLAVRTTFGSTSPWTVTTSSVLDSFDRADDPITLGVTDTGQPWLALSGQTWGTLGNEAYLPSGAGGSNAVAVVETGLSDGYVEAVVGSARESGWGVVCRYADVSNYLYATLTTASASWRVIEVVGGVTSVLLAATLGPTPPGTVARLEFVGTAITLRLNGAPLGAPAASNPALSGNTKHGLRAGTAVTSASRWDDLDVVGNDVCVTNVAEDCELLFVSDHDPSLNVGYDFGFVDTIAEREWTRLDAARKVFYPIYGRDRQVAFSPSERLGDQWSAPIVVNAVDLPTPEGRDVFDALEAVAEAIGRTIPVVTVLDSDGGVWIGCLQVPTLRRREPGRLYIAEITVTETSPVPVPVQ